MESKDFFGSLSRDRKARKTFRVTITTEHYSRGSDKISYEWVAKEESTVYLKVIFESDGVTGIVCGYFLFAAPPLLVSRSFETLTKLRGRMARLANKLTPINPAAA